MNTTAKLTSLFYLLFLLLMTTALSGCLQTKNDINLPDPLYSGKKTVNPNETAAIWNSADVAAVRQPRLREPGKRIQTPMPVVRGGKVRTAQELVNQLKLGNQPITFSAEDIPLPEFINEVFGDILQLSYQVAPTLRGKTDLVTLRLSKPVTQRRLFLLSSQVLEQYGVGIVEQEGMLFFTQITVGDSLSPAILISGRALPDVPNTHRTVFQHVPLKVVKANTMVGWLQQIYKPLGVNMRPEITTNAILLDGPGKVIRQAIQAIALLDQPSFSGRYSARFELAFQPAEKMRTAVINALTAEGYNVTEGNAQIPGSIRIVTLDFINSLLVFTSDPKTLSHVDRWIKNLDQAPEEKPDVSSSTFYYEVKNTKAASLFEVLQKLIAGRESSGISEPAPAAINQTGNTTDTAKAATATNSVIKSAQSKLVLDEVRNAILFMGDPKEWQKLRKIIARMDRQVRQVLVEVTIAEVSLTDQENYGIEWLAKLELDGRSGVLSTIGGLNLGGSGLLYTLESAGQTRALLNLMASNQDVSIVSTPKILVKSGESASIDVGSEVPIVTAVASASSQSDGTSDIQQEIQYRKTGVLLKVLPTIHSGNRVDLEISQEVSEARENTVSNISSPSIFNRKINTSVSLKDGGSLLLGGLITSTGDFGETGIPILKDLPVAGHLFKGTRKTAEKRELIILIRPYIIENDEQAYSLTRSQQQRLNSLKK